VNGEKRMKKTRPQLDFALSFALLHYAQKEKKRVRAAAATEGLFDLKPVALDKLRSKRNDVSKLSMKNI
jgi:hypothetical protein